MIKQQLDQEKLGLRDDQPETHRFFRCFTAPAATRVAMDAYHTMSRYRLTLMIATMIGGNGQIWYCLSKARTKAEFDEAINGVSKKVGLLRLIYA